MRVRAALAIGAGALLAILGLIVGVFAIYAITEGILRGHIRSAFFGSKGIVYPLMLAAAVILLRFSRDLFRVGVADSNGPRRSD